MELLLDQECHQMVHQSHHQELPLTESLLALECHQMEIQGQRPMELLLDQECHQMVHQSHHQELPLTESLLALECHQMEIQGQRPMELLLDLESHQMVPQYYLPLPRLQQPPLPQLLPQQPLQQPQLPPQLWLSTQHLSNFAPILVGLMKLSFVFCGIKCKASLRLSTHLLLWLAKYWLLVGFQEGSKDKCPSSRLFRQPQLQPQPQLERP